MVVTIVDGITAVSGGAGGGSPTGSAGGFLTGTYPNPGVVGYVAFAHNDAPVGNDSPSITFGSTANSIGGNTGFANNIWGGGTPGYPNTINMTGSTTVLALTNIDGGYDNTVQHSTGNVAGTHNRTNYQFTLSETFMFAGGNAAGVISTSGTGVTGSGTNFVNTSRVGGYIQVGANTALISAIATATGMTLASPLSGGSVSGVTYKTSAWPVPNTTFTPNDGVNHAFVYAISTALYDGAYTGVFGGAGHTIGYDGTTVVSSLGAGIFGGYGQIVCGNGSATLGGQWNMIKSSAASGYCAILAGTNNTINGGSWAMMGGQSCQSNANWTLTFGQSVINNGAGTIALGNAYTTTATNSLVCGGGHSVSSGAYNLHGGFANVNSGSYNAVLGYINQVVTASYSLAVGRENLVATDYSVVTGYKCRANKIGQAAQASGVFTSVADAQTSVLVVRRNTTNATPAVLTTDGAAPSTTVNTIQVSSTSTNTFCATAYKITVIAMAQGSTANQGRWTFEGIITKGTNNAATTKQAGEIAGVPQLIGTFATASVATSANTTSGLLDITVTGVAATNINWVARVELTEVTYV